MNFSVYNVRIAFITSLILKRMNIREFVKTISMIHIGHSIVMTSMQRSDR